MNKHELAGGFKLPQIKGRFPYFIKASEQLKLSSTISGCIVAFPMLLQTFLFNLWTLFERIQDSISDKSSPIYRIFEVVNSILFKMWVRTGRRL